VDIQDNLPIDLDQDILKDQENLDEEILMGQDAGCSMTILTGFQWYALRLHVLLVACSAQEIACEYNKHSCFMRAFLDTLKEVGTDKIMYTGLIQRLPKLLNK
jgi:hypothetical protein